jgi:hypothetical protein
MPPALVNHVQNITITPARYIYKREKNSNVWLLINLFYEYEHLHKHAPSMSASIEAWQWVKAIVQILKEKNYWDSINGKPCIYHKKSRERNNREQYAKFLLRRGYDLKTVHEKVDNAFGPRTIGKYKKHAQSMADALLDPTMKPYMKLTPGTVEWNTFYKQHPEWKFEMDKYRWKKERGINIDGPFI